MDTLNNSYFQGPGVGSNTKLSRSHTRPLDVKFSTHSLKLRLPGVPFNFLYDEIGLSIENVNPFNSESLSGLNVTGCPGPRFEG